MWAMSSFSSKYVEFRRQFGISSTLKNWTPPEVLTKFTPGGFFGEDREGHPVWHSNMGNLDIRGEEGEAIDCA